MEDEGFGIVAAWQYMNDPPARGVNSSEGKGARAAAWRGGQASTA
jgi:hypothetical protein